MCMPSWRRQGQFFFFYFSNMASPDAYSLTAFVIVLSFVFTVKLIVLQVLYLGIGILLGYGAPCHQGVRVICPDGGEQVSLKRRYGCTRRHGVISQKTAVFTDTAKRT